MRRALVAVVGILGLMVATAAPAGAVPSPYSRLDPVNTENVYAKNDIKSIRIETGPTITVTLRTREGVNPAAHPAWKTANGSTFIAWTFDSSDNDQLFALSMRSTASGPGEPVINAGLVQPCDGSQITFTFLPPNGYRFSFPEFCVLNATRLRAVASYRFNPVGNPPHKTDRAPNAGYTPFVDDPP
jgi:hypothetical protein